LLPAPGAIGVHLAISVSAHSQLVTETDQGVEKFVAEKIRSAYPKHEFIGEESYAAGEKHALGDAPTWIVDPVDVPPLRHRTSQPELLELTLPAFDARARRTLSTVRTILAELAQSLRRWADHDTSSLAGFPMCCISIGFTVGGVPVVGVVYNPFLDQLFSAAEGQGAFLNESARLPLVSPPPSLPSLSQALIGVECKSLASNSAESGPAGCS
jgi:myo-inositol-1(or 4)-monophosphatase